MANRRDFIRNVAVLGLGSPVASLAAMNAAPFSTFPDFENYNPPGDDEFWLAIQQSFAQPNEFINLENGFFSPAPLPVLNKMIERTRHVNLYASNYMRTKMNDEKEAVRKELASFAGVDAEELALLRNTTEALNILINGLPWQKGDEVIMCLQDYGSMQEALHQRAKRDGIVIKIIDLPLHPKDDAEIVRVYEKAITSKSRALLITHMINITGQILPVKKLCDMAHSHNVEVMVDGAHTFAHLDFKIPDLNCDYYAASLHKWLCNPLGAGILWAKKEKIEKIWPLLGDTSQPKDNIRKFEHVGTNPVANYLTIPAAIKFHNLVGSQHKQERLRYLKNYWVQQVKDIPGITFNTPPEDQRTCAIANVAVKGLTPAQFSKKLYDEHKIFTVAIETEKVNGVRVTPHLYTTTEQLDKLVAAIRQMA